MRANSPFIRFANLFTERRTLTNASIITITTSDATLISGPSMDVIVDTFALVQLDVNLQKLVTRNTIFTRLTNEDGTATFIYLAAGVDPTINEQAVEAGEFRRRSEIFWLRFTAGGTFVPTYKGSTITDTGRIAVNDLNMEFYIFL